MTHPLHHRIVSAVLHLDDADPLKLSRELMGGRVHVSPALFTFASRCMDLSAAIRLARGGPFTGAPLDHLPGAARAALTNPDAVAAWVCAPLNTDPTGA